MAAVLLAIKVTSRGESLKNSAHPRVSQPLRFILDEPSSDLDETVDWLKDEFERLGKLLFSFPMMKTFFSNG